MQDLLDLVALDACEEELVRGVRVVWLDVGAVRVFGGDEVEALFAGAVWGGLEEAVEAGFPDHVGDAVAD